MSPRSAGGFASNEIGVNQSDFAYRPETSTNYEAGLKTSFFERRLVLFDFLGDGFKAGGMEHLKQHRGADCGEGRSLG